MPPGAIAAARRRPEYRRPDASRVNGCLDATVPSSKAVTSNDGNENRSAQIALVARERQQKNLKIFRRDAKKNFLRERILLSPDMNELVILKSMRSGASPDGD